MKMNGDVIFSISSPPGSRLRKLQYVGAFAPWILKSREKATELRPNTGLLTRNRLSKDLADLAVSGPNDGLSNDLKYGLQPTRT
jgi:hypothetical protein